MNECKICEKEKITYNDINPIYIGYDDGTTDQIEDVLYCSLHGIFEID